MKHILFFCIWLYRKIISPLKPPCCRFTPTCSAYALEAFKNRGLWKGLFYSVLRILRCNPFFRGGYDPVPYGRPFKKIDLLRKKMGEKQNCVSSVVTTEPKRRRKVVSLPYRE